MRAIERRKNNRETLNQRRMDNRNAVVQSNRRRQSLFRCAVRGSDNFTVPETLCLGSLSVQCSHCGALLFSMESKSNCCHCAKLSHLPTGDENFPVELKNVFVRTDNKSKNFRQFIHQFNNANAFSSMGAKIHDMPGSVYCFKISGEVYHRSVENIPIELSLNSANYYDRCKEISYAELFIYVLDTAVNIRMNNPANASCNREIMIIISTVLEEPFSLCYVLQET